MTPRGDIPGEIHLAGQNTITIHRREWSRSELIERMASRFFIIGDESISRYSWIVEARSGYSNGDAISGLNEELVQLGLIGTISSMDPPTLTIRERSYGSDILPAWQLASIWLFSSIMAIFAGSAWSRNVGISGNTYVTSILYYVLPLILTLAFASECKRRMNRDAGIRSGQIIPLAIPQISPIWWPFGLFGLFSQKSSEYTPVPDRRTLAKIEITIPAILFIVGQPLVLAGILLTPSAPPENLASAPLVFHGSIIPNLIAPLLIESDVGIRLQWIHPLGLAGLSLSVLGWLLLLPIPGLPGDRILSAIMGSERHLDISSQNILFVASLGALVLVFVSSDFVPWLLIATIACMRRFGNDQLRPPLVVNLADGFPRESLERYAAATVIILLLGIPGMSPATEFEQWSEGLDPTPWPSSIEVNDTQDFEIPLTPIGAIPLSGEIAIEIDDPSESGWQVTDSDGIPVDEIKFENIIQSNEQKISLKLISSPPESYLVHPARIILTIDDGVTIRQHPILVTIPGGSAPFSSSWLLEGNSTSACIDIETSVDDPGIWSVDHPFWLSEDTEMEPGVRSRHCIEPLPGAIEGADRDERGRAMAPEITFTPEGEDQGDARSWQLPIKASESWLGLPSGNWTVPDRMLIPNIRIAHGNPDFDPSCVKTSSMDTHTNLEGPIDWNLGTASLTLSPNPISVNLTIPSEGWMVVCDGREMIEVLRIKEGLDIQSSDSGMGIAIDSETFSIENRENMTVTVSREWSGDVPSLDVWHVDGPDSIAANQSVEVTVTFDSDGGVFGSVWLTTDDNGVILHLAARCPSGGCT